MKKEATWWIWILMAALIVMDIVEVIVAELIVAP